MQEFMQNIKVQKVIVLLGTIIAIFFAVKIVSDMRAYKYIGQDVASARTISFNGTGDVFAIPDIANISFSASKDADTVAQAQKDVTDKIDAALAVLEKNGIEKKDIKTIDYSATPKYDIQPPCVSGYCPNREQKIIGYTVSQTIAVKVRDTSTTGAILDGLAKAEVSNITGPNFSIDDEETIKAQARAKAIDDAKAKAQVLARQLGVKLGRIVSFSDSSGGYYPMAYDKSFGGAMTVASEAAPTPQIPTGENKITSNVTITYEIR